MPQQRIKHDTVACTAVAMQWLQDRRKTTAVCRQLIGKHVPVATDTHATIKLLLQTVFSTRSVQRDCKEEA
jgi:hypothetical protein